VGERARAAILVIEHDEMARSFVAQILRSRGVFAAAFSRAADAPDGRFACAVTADPAVNVRPQVVITSPLDAKQHPIRVTRPVGERELIDAVGVALGLTDAIPDYTLEPAQTAKTSSLRVLLVEDSDVNLEVVSEMLRRLGHEVSLAADGEVALATMSSQRFDLVFMDVQLPGMDGLEVTRQYRDGGGKAPIVALTAHTSSRDRDRCIAAGMRRCKAGGHDAAREGDRDGHAS
jgi:CheY-like chemotaxis protein